MKTKLFLIGVLVIIGLSTNAQYTDLLNFNGTSNPQGKNPSGSLIISGSTLFGMAYLGGAS